MMHGRQWWIFVAFAPLLSQCGSGSGGGGGGAPPTPRACSAESDCPSGQGCYATSGGADRYCTKLCSANSDCSGQYLCPTFDPLAEPDCRQSPDHQGKGVCQIYDRSLGPNACASAAPSK